MMHGTHISAGLSYRCLRMTKQDVRLRKKEVETTKRRDKQKQKSWWCKQSSFAEMPAEFQATNLHGGSLANPTEFVHVPLEGMRIPLLARAGRTRGGWRCRCRNVLVLSEGCWSVDLRRDRMEQKKGHHVREFEPPATFTCRIA